MVLPSNKPLDDVIAWHFHVAEQYHHARYGTYGGFYWKQFTPGGTVIMGLHPPKRISKAIYERAKKFSEK